MFERLKSLHVRKALRGQRPISIADAGCGRSGMLGWFGGIAPTTYPLSRFFRKSQVVGFDRIQEVIEHNVRCATKGRAPNLRFEAFDIMTADSGRQFDVVVFSGISNSPSDIDVVHAASRLVRPCGLLVMIVASNVEFLFGKKVKWLRTQGYAPQTLVAVLHDLELEPLSVHPILGRWATFASISSRRVSAINFALLAFIFPFLILLAAPELVRYPSQGQALLAVVSKPEA